jgi:uncharacterized membrane protein
MCSCRRPCVSCLCGLCVSVVNLFAALRERSHPASHRRPEETLHVSRGSLHVDALKAKKQEHYESGKFMERFYKDREQRLEKPVQDG